MTFTLTDPAGGVGDAIPTEAVGRRSRRHGGGITAAILHNRKAVAGLAILVVFCVLAAVPQWFTSVSDPNKRQFELRLPPSSAHWLGTTAFGQDITAQLIY